MSLLIILFSLITERFMGELKEYRRFTWFHSFVTSVFNRTKEIRALNGMFGVLLILLSFTIVIGLAFHELYERSMLLWFLLAGVTLVYSLGPKTFYEDIKYFCQAMDANNHESALWYTEDLLDRQLTDDEKHHLTRTAIEGLFVASSDRLFGALFWFVVAGPAGAVMYRLSSQLGLWGERCNLDEKNCRFAEATQRLHYLVSWLPIRLLAFSFGLAGDFARGIAQCRTLDSNTCSRWKNHNAQIVICAGLGALGKDIESLEQHNKANVAAALALIRRTVLLWLVGAALLTLMGLVN